MLRQATDKTCKEAGRAPERETNAEGRARIGSVGKKQWYNDDRDKVAGRSDGR